MENTYRDVNIAIANEFSRLADKFGVDVWEAISIANLHPRVKILAPGPGVGGHCISVDPWFFVEAAPELTPLIYHSRQVNDAQPHFVVNTVKRALGSLDGKKIAVLGLAYKPDVDDLRESPANEIVHLLQHEGARVKVWEPFKPDANLAGIIMSPTFDDAIKDADVLLLLVNHTEFRKFDPVEIAGKTKARILVDTVNGWSNDTWKKAVQYFCSKRNRNWYTSGSRENGAHREIACPNSRRRIADLCHSTAPSNARPGVEFI